MANHKAGIKYITIAGVRVQVPSHAQVLFLYDNVNGNASVDTFLDVRDNTAYKVPTNKFFYPIGFQISSKTFLASDYVEIGEGDTENVMTSVQDKILTPPISEVVDFFHGDLLSQSYSSSKFIVYDPSGTNLNWISCIGYEL